MISPETIALVRDRTDILAVISESVPSLKRRGRSWVGLCPFHKEKTPSFHVNPDRGFFHCFGCKESGSAIDFLIKNEGYTFPEAVRALAERAGIQVEESQKTGAFAEQDRQKKARDELYAVNQLAATFYEQELRKNEHKSFAIEELEKRGLTPGKDQRADDALQAFRIGYAPAGWDGLANFLRAQGVSPAAAETVGLLVPRSNGSGYYDRFRHRLMFAVVDPQGRVVAFSGRALSPLPSQQGEEKPPKYINSPESPIYTKGQMLFGIHQARHAIRQKETAILVEGNFDVVSLHARGIDNVVAPLGTAFTVEQAKLLRRFASSIVFLFDGDAAGKKAVKVSGDAVRDAGLFARVATLPDGVDPDELSRQKGAEAITNLVESAKGLAEALIDMELDATFVQADVFERRERLDRVLKLVTDQADPIARMELRAYVDSTVMARLDLHGMRITRDDQFHHEPFKSVHEQIRRAEAAAMARGEKPKRAVTPREARIAAPVPGAAERKAIVGALIEQPSLLDDAEVAGELSLLEGVSATIVAALRRSLRVVDGAASSLDTDAFLSQIPASHKAFAAARLAGPEMESREEAREYLLENANKLKRLLLSEEAAEFTRETYRAQGDFRTEGDLLREASDRLRAKRGIKV